MVLNEKVVVVEADKDLCEFSARIKRAKAAVGLVANFFSVEGYYSLKD